MATQIDSVTRTTVQSQLQNACPEWTNIAEISICKAIKSRRDAGDQYGITQSQQPLLQGTLAVRALVMHKMNGHGTVT